jgi:hypothetical protein
MARSPAGPVTDGDVLRTLTYVMNYIFHDSRIQGHLLTCLPYTILKSNNVYVMLLSCTNLLNASVLT